MIYIHGGTHTLYLCIMQLYYIHVYLSCECVSFWNVFLSSDQAPMHNICFTHIFNFVLAMPKMFAD